LHDADFKFLIAISNSVAVTAIFDYIIILDLNGDWGGQIS